MLVLHPSLYGEMYDDVLVKRDSNDYNGIVNLVIFSCSYCDHISGGGNDNINNDNGGDGRPIPLFELELRPPHRLGATDNFS